MNPVLGDDEDGYDDEDDDDNDDKLPQNHQQPEPVVYQYFTNSIIGMIVH